MKNPTFTMRPDTCDPLVVQEVWYSDCYGFKGRDWKGKSVFDIGANIGAFTVLAALEGAIVSSYEPEPNNYAILQRNCLDNAVSPTLSAKGVGYEGYGWFDDNNGGTRKGIHGAKVEIVSVNGLWDSPVDFLKVDVEGSEYEIVLDATEKTLSLVREFAAEFHPDLTDQETHEEAMAKLSRFFDLRITGGIPQRAGGIVFGKRKAS